MCVFVFVCGYVDVSGGRVGRAKAASADNNYFEDPRASDDWPALLPSVTPDGLLPSLPLFLPFPLSPLFASSLSPHSSPLPAPELSLACARAVSLSLTLPYAVGGCKSVGGGCGYAMQVLEGSVSR